MPTAVRPDTGAPEIILGSGQPQYFELPAAVYEDTQYNSPMLLTRWTLTDEERLRIANGEDIYISTLTYGYKFQPMSVMIGPEPYKLKEDPCSGNGSGS